MAEVRKIQCPSCGSNSTYKLFDGNYKCNYCQSNFMVNEGSSRGQVPVYPSSGQRPSSASPAKVMALAIGACVVMGIAGGMVYFLSAKPSTLTELTTQQQTLQKQPKLKSSRAFAGSAGSVVWMITENNKTEDSLYYELVICDPQSQVEKGRSRIGKVFTSYESPDLAKLIGYRFWQYGDLAYSIGEDKNLRATNIYTGKTQWDNALLFESFPELNPGILKVEQNASDNLFVITTTAGDIVKFDPYTQTIITTPAKEKRRSEEPVTTELYLSDGLKHHLYRFTKKGDGFPIVFGGYVQESRLPGPSAPKKNNVKDIFGNLHIEQVSDKNYFRAQSLLKDEQGNVLILYKTDLTEGASVVLESVNKEGKTNWSLREPLLSMVGKAFASEDLGCEYSFFKNTLIINLSDGEQQYMAIDISSGKILWSFNPTAYLRAKAS